MKLKLFTLLLAGLFTTFGFATEVTFTGTITFGPDGFEEPAEGYPVNIYSNFPNPDGTIIEITVQTDENGIYTATLDIEPTGGTVYAVIIEIFDFCNGEIISTEVEIVPGDVGPIEQNFHICQDVNPPPPPMGCEAFFFYEQISVDPYTVQFFDLSYSDIDAITWLWDFGDGTSSNEPSPTHDYANIGTYEVSLTIESDSCTSTFLFPVDVMEELECFCDATEFEPVCVQDPASGEILVFANACYAACEGFGPDNFVVCEDDCICPDFYAPVCVLLANGDTLQFDNPCFAECEGYGPDSYIDCGFDPCGCDAFFGPPVCVILDDGTVVTFMNECVAMCEGYSPDQYFYCDTPDGCFANIWIGYPDDPASLHIQFEDVSVSTLGAIEHWEWDFGDGATSTDQHPSHEYAEAGIYEVTLTIITNEGCTSTITQHICVGFFEDCVCPDIYDPVCVELGSGTLFFPNLCEAECAGFTADDVVDCPDDPCDCPEYYDPVCAITPDGEIIQFDNICFALCEGYGPDSFVDCEDDCICPDIYDPVCVINPNGNVITFSNACFAACEGYGPDSFVNCDDNCNCTLEYDPVCVISPNGDIITFSNACFAACAGYGPDSFVDCEDNCTCPDIYDPVCVYTAGAVLFFFNACEAECAGYGPDTHADCEDGNDCHAFFFLEQDAPNGLLVNFIDESQAEAGTIEQWLWDFGDGTTSEEQNPSHEYAEEGIYEVTLTITTSEGCSSTFAQHICIGNGDVFGGPDCQAMFFFEQTSDDLTTFSFFDMSLGEATSWAWDFGDGNSSEEQNPVHSYEQPGLYVVTLTISNADCESSAAMLLISNEDIWYDNECVALFLPIIIPDSNQVFFLNLSSGDVVSSEWDFGDGTTSTDFIAIHQYAAGGTYEVTLTITTAAGCTNTFSVTLNLDDDNFTANPAYLTLTDTDEPEALEQVRLYPNPAIDDLIIGFEAENAENHQLEILSANGQLLQKHLWRSSAGSNLTSLDISQLTSGLYLLRISTNSTTKTMKFVKQ